MTNRAQVRSIASGRIWGKAVVTVLIAGLLWRIQTAHLFARAIAQWSTHDLHTLQLRSCISNEKAFVRILSQYSGDSDVRQIQDRLARIDMLAIQIGNALDPNLASARTNLDTQLADPIQFFDEHDTEFSSHLSFAALTSEERTVVRGYYLTRVGAATTYVCERARVVAASHPGDVTLPQSCLLIPLLSLAGDYGTSENFDYFPDWVMDSFNLTIMEYLSLRTGNLQFAYQCKLANCASLQQRQSFIEYAESATDSLIKGKYFSSAVRCLERIIERGKFTRDELFSLKCMLAEAQQKSGDSSAALLQVADLLKEFQDSDHYGRAATLHLKFLYESNQFTFVRSEAAMCATDVRCSAEFPEIMYFAWAAARQNGQKGEEIKWKEMFLKNYPNHVLGADLYFAEAIQSMSIGNYTDAQRIFAIIERHYPHSTLVPKIKDLEQRLNAANLQVSSTG